MHHRPTPCLLSHLSIANVSSEMYNYIKRTSEYKERKQKKKNWRDVGGACPCQLRFVEGLFDDSGPTRGPFRLVLERHTLTPVRNEEKKRPSPFFHGLTRLMRSDRRTPPSLSLFCWRFTHTHQKTHKTIKKIEQL